MESYESGETILMVNWNNWNKNKYRCMIVKRVIYIYIYIYRWSAI